MNESILKLLYEYIDCRIDEKIADAFRRDGSAEYLKVREAKALLELRVLGHYIKD